MIENRGWMTLQIQWAVSKNDRHHWPVGSFWRTLAHRDPALSLEKYLVNAYRAQRTRRGPIGQLHQSPPSPNPWEEVPVTSRHART